MAYIAKLAQRLARLRAIDSAHLPSMLSLLLVAACAAGEPTGISTVSLPDLPDAPVVVSPRRMTLEGGQQVLFRAYESDLTTQVTSIEWTTSGGSIGADGSYSSSAAGDFRVVGKRKGNPHNAPDTSTVTVVPVQTTLSGVVVSPSGASVIGGQQQQYAAAGLMSDGSTVAIGVTWSTTGGTIDAGGLFMAGNTSGTFQVVATHVTTGIADTVPVTVQAVQSIAISPTSTSLSAGGTQQFTTTGTLADGSKVSLATVGYSVTGGTISTSGLYTAPLTGGSYAATAQLAPGTATSTTARVTSTSAAVTSASAAVTSTSATVTSPSATAAINVLAATSSGTGPYPNKPAGTFTILDEAFTALPSAAPLTGVVGSISGSNWTLQSLTSAPQSPSGVGQVRYPAGMASGAETGGWNGWLNNAAQSLTGKTEVRQLYISVRLRVPTPDFELEGTGTKLFYVSHGSEEGGGQVNQDFMSFEGVGTSAPAIRSSTRFVMNISPTADAGGPSYPKRANVAGADGTIMTFGSWHQLEIYLNAGTVDHADGVYKAWLDGRLFAWYGAGGPGPAPQFLASAYGFTHGFYLLHFFPVWGGNNPGFYKTRNDDIQFDHIYVAGIQ